jgi:hypothetical protein
MKPFMWPVVPLTSLPYRHWPRLGSPAFVVFQSALKLAAFAGAVARKQNMSEVTEQKNTRISVSFSFETRDAYDEWHEIEQTVFEQCSSSVRAVFEQCSSLMVANGESRKNRQETTFAS